MRIGHALGLLGVALIASACDDAEDGDPPVASIYAEIEAKVLAVSCTFSSCHGATTPREDLSLVPGVAYDQIVDKPSKEIPTRMRVKPGDPEGSYLYEKLTKAKPAVGERMPPGQPLGDNALRAIRQWIADGARR
jgi:hypothetical protein